MIDKRIIAFFKLLYYKLIALGIFEELALVEFYNERTLADPPNAYFSDGFYFIGA